MHNCQQISSPIPTEPLAQSEPSTDMQFNHRGIHIANMNVRHLKPKMDEIKILLDSANCIDVFGLCETFLTETTENDALSISGYNIERKDRCETNSTTNNGGGILIYLNSQLNFIRRKDIECNEIESVWVEIRLCNNKPFLLCPVYRPPSSNATWCEHFSKQIEKASIFTSEFYILGDININIEGGTILNTTWKHVVELNDLQQLVTTPTRITAHSSTIIDHLYVSSQDKITETFVPNIAISDHFPICFTRSASKANCQRHTHTAIKYRCYKKFNEDDFLFDLSEALAFIEISNNDSSKKFKIWTSTFIDMFDKHAPMKSKRVKHETQHEWINDEIKMAIKIRDAYHKRKNWKQYKFWRNKTTALIRTSKKNFFTRSVSGNKDTSFLWKHVRNISGNNNDRQIPKEINVENERIYEGDEVIEKLNLFFSKISEKLVSEHPQQDLPFDFDKLTSYVNAKVHDNIKCTYH